MTLNLVLIILILSPVRLFATAFLLVQNLSWTEGIVLLLFSNSRCQREGNSLLSHVFVERIFEIKVEFKVIVVIPSRAQNTKVAFRDILLFA